MALSVCHRLLRCHTRQICAPDALATRALWAWAEFPTTAVRAILIDQGGRRDALRRGHREGLPWLARCIALGGCRAEVMMTASSSRVLLCLDVDGTICPVPPHDGPRASRWVTPVAEPVLAELHELACRSGVMMGWVTTWMPGMLEWLVKARLDGRFDAPYLPDEADRSRGWRARSIVKTVAEVGTDAVVWIDDAAVRSTLTRALARAGLDPAVLVIRPDERVGVTLRDVRRAARFVDEHTRR